MTYISRIRNTLATTLTGGTRISQLPLVNLALLEDLIPAVQNGITVSLTLEQILALGLTLQICDLATTGQLTASYNNADAGMGATLINSTTLAALVIDSVTVSVGQIIMVKDQSLQYQNGIYIVTVVGDGATAWQLMRVTHYNQAQEINDGDFFTVTLGTINANTQWIQDNEVNTIGTDPITFIPNIVVTGGLTKTNNTINSQGGLLTQEITGTSANIIPNTKYITSNNAMAVVLTLPVTCPLGDVIEVIGKGSAGWQIAQNAGQIIYGGAALTTVGVAGSLASGEAKNTVYIVCTKADIEFTILASYDKSLLVFT
jgi:hypothetical protein